MILDFIKFRPPTLAPLSTIIVLPKAFPCRTTTALTVSELLCCHVKDSRSWRTTGAPPELSLSWGRGGCHHAPVSSDSRRPCAVQGKSSSHATRIGALPVEIRTLERVSRYSGEQRPRHCYGPLCAAAPKGRCCQPFISRSTNEIRRLKTDLV
jgi:hypothetical protein